MVVIGAMVMAVIMGRRYHHDGRDVSAAGELCVGDQVSYALTMLRLAGLVGFREDGPMVVYRLADGFPHQLLEHCLRQLPTIASSEAGHARA